MPCAIWLTATDWQLPEAIGSLVSTFTVWRDGGFQRIACVYRWAPTALIRWIYFSSFHRVESVKVNLMWKPNLFSILFPILFLFVYILWWVSIDTYTIDHLVSKGHSNSLFRNAIEVRGVKPRHNRINSLLASLYFLIFEFKKYI